jgi:4-phytase/acid phosphatase
MRRQIIAVALLLSALASSCAATERVVQEVALVRHGIRSPTTAADALAPYASQPWPAWDVAPGQLTGHGAALMHAWGAWYRQRLASEGLVPRCDDVRVIADSTPRNRDSAAALVRGLVPGCAARYDALAPTQVDPLFHGVGKGKKAQAANAASPAFSSSALASLQQVLLGCTDRACLERARSEGKRVPMLEPAAKALKQAGTLSENLMLEYAQGMPPAQVGWGRADANAIARMIVLHNDSFAFTDKAADAARARGGNLLVHVAATLARAAHADARVPTLARHGQHIVVLVGHDTDLASQSGLLQLQWHNATQPDDYPPAGTLIYQLVERHGQYVVRLFAAQPTLAALRDADVAGAHAMTMTPLALPACDGRRECPLARFEALVGQRVEASFVLPDSGDEPGVH